MTVHRLLVPEISRGRLAVTSSLLKTIGAPSWAIMPFAIATGATVVLSHEWEPVVRYESQTSSIFAKSGKFCAGKFATCSKWALFEFGYLACFSFVTRS